VTVKSGLAVAILPVEDHEEQRKYFGVDLRFKGYVPALVVIENNAPDSFILRRDSITFGESGSTPFDPSKTTKSDKAMWAAEAIPWVGIAASMNVVATGVAMQNMLRKQLQSVTLARGASAHGFVFVPSPRGNAARKKVQLKIPFEESGRDETLVFDLVF
jgi:hypothetical protein